MNGGDPRTKSSCKSLIAEQLRHIIYLVPRTKAQRRVTREGDQVSHCALLISQIKTQ